MGQGWWKEEKISQKSVNIYSFTEKCEYILETLHKN